MTTATTTIDSRLSELAKQYLRLEQNPKYKSEIETLIAENNARKLDALIGHRLTFGTAGIRGGMGAGFTRMNNLVVIQTSQGLVSYLLELNASGVKEQGVIIGYDARHNSAIFARLAALAFLQKSIPVYFCEHIIPTPIVAFGVKLYGCMAGIMITASHNPKHDNGYKVYFANGAQILSPHDINIQRHIEMPQNLTPWTKAWQHDILTQEPNSNDLLKLVKEWTDLFVRVHAELCKSYFTYLETLVGERKESNSASKIGITHTALHGVGHMFLSRALDIAGFDDSFPVELQKKPDPEFSTLRLPNPEESGALDLAFETAQHANSNLILANDPDADRLGAATYDPTTGYKRILNGNEIGSLLGWWIWHCYTTKDSDSKGASMGFGEDDGSQETSEEAIGTTQKKISSLPASDCYMIASAVSSTFLESMARIEGFNFIQTLTGFKNMCNRADQIHKSSNGMKKVLFAFEEALGYMVDTTVMDKDGISAAVQLAQCAAYCKSTYNRTLEDQLDFLYVKYGFHFNINSYYICRNPSTVTKIFEQLQRNPPTKFVATADDGNRTEFQVIRRRDLNTGYDSGEPDKRAKLPSSTSSQMLTFYIDGGMNITFRTSGTEPKIKFYSEVVAVLPSINSSDASLPFGSESIYGVVDELVERQLAAKEIARAELSKLVQISTKICLQPDKYELEPAD